jgi:hypothetical protein
MGPGEAKIRSTPGSNLNNQEFATEKQRILGRYPIKQLGDLDSGW